jgi:quercetin 2,3-dioxygenase
MSNIYHPAPERGHVDFGWLDSHHSFSFGNWHDRDKVHFGALRVLNDDVVRGGNSFDNHPHENMEVISIPLKGTLAHRDSTGIEGILSTGDVQVISVPKQSEVSGRGGRGTKPAEGLNGNREAQASGPREAQGAGSREAQSSGSREAQSSGPYTVQIRPLDQYDPVNLLQIWIFPKQPNTKPRHDQKSFDPAGRIDRWQVIVSPRAVDGGLLINQDARLSLSRLNMGTSLSYETVFPGNGTYIFVLAGSVEIGEYRLAPRDGLGISGIDSFTLHTEMGAEVLAIEVPMFA